MRDLVRETHLNKDDLIMPVFVDATINGREEIPSMPGIYRYSLDSILDEITEIVKLGIKQLLFSVFQKEKMKLELAHGKIMELFNRQFV